MQRSGPVLSPGDKVEDGRRQANSWKRLSLQIFWSGNDNATGGVGVLLAE